MRGLAGLHVSSLIGGGEASGQLLLSSQGICILVHLVINGGLPNSLVTILLVKACNLEAPTDLGTCASQLTYCRQHVNPP